ncbi:MAG TPA: hypothetical protein VIF15_16980, partial [Polyangiaceae bacterium]
MARSWFALAAVALVAACSGGGGGGPAPTSLYDDDTVRLAHCAFEAPPPHEALPAPAPGGIRAGYGSAVLSLPIGVPFGGYTNRSKSLRAATPIDARASRWATDFVPSAGVADAPRAEALALEIAGQRWVIARIDTVLVLAPT